MVLVAGVAAGFVVSVALAQALPETPRRELPEDPLELALLHPL